MAAATEKLNTDPNPDEILKEVRNFVKGSAYKATVSNEELARSALYLLRTLPSARQAVLEHLCSVFDDAVQKHLLHTELGDKAVSEGSALDSVIADVKDVMMGFVKSNPDAWAPIISAWSIELLGQISSEYTGRHTVPLSSSLNELLQLWMTCPPTSVLIEIASECFASMVGSTPDVCVSALLEASVKHSPHFDWVVAHIGSCFPTTIITRVLMCGLKDFYTQGQDQSAHIVIDQKVPKLASVVGILGHLAAQHGPDIRMALVSLFQESLKEDCEDMHLAAVPFLLHLASMSPLLLRVITLDFVSTVTPSVLNNLAKQFSTKKVHALQDKESLVVLLVHLIITCDVGAYRILQFLLDNAVPPPQKEDSMDTGDAPVEAVQQTCTTVMEHLLLEIQQKIHRQSARSGEIAFLMTLQQHTDQMCRQLVRSEGKRYEWLCQVMCNMAAYCDDVCASRILSTVLQEATESAQLGVFIRIQNAAQVFHPEVMDLTMQDILEVLSSSQGSPMLLRTTLRNVLRITQWESKQSTRSQARHSLQEALHAGLTSLSPSLYHQDVEVAAVAMELLNVIGLPGTLGIDCITKLCCATATFFFRCLHSPEAAVKCQNARQCQCYMAALCKFTSAQRILTRILLEETLSEEHAPVFGSKTKPQSPKAKLKSTSGPQLLEANMRRAPSNLPQGRARIFHGGIIGRGLKPLPRPSAFSQEEQICNRNLIVEALWLCNTTIPHVNPSADESTARGRSPSPSPGTSPGLSTMSLNSIPERIGRNTALLLVELVAPDVMYNGIPWPEEDFMKVTVERDIQIRKMFDDNPVLWDIMEMLSHSSGALCYCSALLRGVAATLIVEWDSCREKAATNLPRHLVTSQRLMETLRKGALISSPLCYVGEMFPALAPYEVCLLLQVVWKYMKENPPVPDPKENLSRGCDRRYTDVIQSIIHTNIDKLGHVYARFAARPAKPPPVPSIPLNADRVRTPPIGGTSSGRESRERETPREPLMTPREHVPSINERLMNLTNSDSIL